MRIVSLLPSATEIVCALGMESSLVARSHECDFPASIRKLPTVTKATFDVHGASRDIDVLVKTHLKNGLSLYELDEQKIKELRPDVIITQAHCDVCAATAKDVEKKISGDLGAGVRIVSLNPTSLASVWADFEKVADAVGYPGLGKTVAQKLRMQMDAIAQKAKLLDERPRVACIEWIDPLMATGNWIPELVDLAGAYNLFGESGVHSPWLSWERLAEKDPDYILLMPCGFDIDRTRGEIAPLLQKKEWPDLQAVYNNRVYLLDGNQFFNRPGPRLLESLEILVEVLHPESFDFEQKMSGWQYL